MSGLVVQGVTRAVEFECSEEGGHYALAMDRLWMWRVCDLRNHADWHPRTNRAYSNHFLAVHREGRLFGCFARFGYLSRRLAGCAAGGVPSEATAPPALPAGQATASNTTPESLNLRLLRQVPGRE